ncbi:MAG: DUF4340 domain-containing protein [Dongiaceae bacterium]
MKPTTFLFVLAATAVSAAAAGYAVVTESQRGAPAAAPGGPLFDELLAQANEVRSVTVESAQGKLTIAHGESGWVLAEKDGYPVAADKVRKLVAGLGGLRLLEAKTDKPERLVRLEVEDVTAADSKSKQVTLAGADGAPLAALIIGKQNDTFDLDGLRGVYVRKPGEPQAWLAEGAVELPATATEWVDRTIVDLGPDKIQRLRFAPVGAAEVTAAKADKTATEFALAPLPEGRSADPQAVQRLAQAFAAMTLDDVRADKDTGKAVAAGTAEAVTFDGLTLKAELLALDGGTWLRLAATAAEGSAAVEEAKAINDRVAGWLYKLPQYKAGLLQPKIDDYLAKPDGQS